MTIATASTQDKNKPREADLAPGVAPDAAPPDVRELVTKRLSVCALNVPHRTPDEELQASVREHGVIEPLIVRPISAAIVTDADGTQREVDHEIVVGERRWRAACLAGLERVLCVVRILTDLEVLEIQQQENLHRENLSPLQEAHAFDLFRVKFNRSPAEIAARLHKTLRYVTQRLTLLELPLPAREALASGGIVLGTALEIACLAEEHRAGALELVTPRNEGPLALREARELITSRFHLLMAGAKFDVADATLVVAAGACTACPKRTSNQLAMFVDGLEADDRCSDRPCWSAKTEAHWARRAAVAAEAGVRVLDMRASGKAGEEARLAVMNPSRLGLVNLDGICDHYVDTKVQKLEEEIIAAEKAGDTEAADKLETELQNLETTAGGATWRDVLGGALKPTVIARELRDDGRRSDVLELVDEKVALRALVDAGHALPDWAAKKLAEPAAAVRPEAAAAPAAEATEPTQGEIDRRAGELLHARLTELLIGVGEKTPPRPGIGFWRALIVGALNAVGYDSDEGLEGLMKRRGWPLDPEIEAAAQIKSKLDGLNEAKLRGLLVDVMCVEPATVTELAQHFEINRKPLLAAAAKQAKAALRAEKAAPAAGKTRKRAARVASSTEEATS